MKKCWCDELGEYRCIDCSPKIDLKRMNLIDRAVMMAYEKFLESKSTNLKEFEDFFWRVDTIREKYKI